MYRSFAIQKRKCFDKGILPFTKGKCINFGGEKRGGAIPMGAIISAIPLLISSIFG